MTEPRTQYTFTLDNEDEKRFNNIMSRLDPDEFEIIEPLHKIPSKREHYAQSEMEAIIEMSPEAASTFRFGMSKVKIRRYRTEDELAEETAILDRNKVTITVKVDGLQP
jgi:hypothetical protein